AVHERIDAKRAMGADEPRLDALDEGKVWPPHQRAIAEHPKIAGGRISDRVHVLSSMSHLAQSVVEGEGCRREVPSHRRDKVGYDLGNAAFGGFYGRRKAGARYRVCRRPGNTTNEIPRAPLATTAVADLCAIGP